ncbi:MAG: CHAT domain-containing protein [Pseudomonadota bacterium]
MAAPVQTAKIGVAFDKIDPQKALPICTAEVNANPNNHASAAHLARVYSKLGQAEKAGELLRAIDDITDPDALAYLGVVYRDGLGGPKDMKRAIAFFKAASDGGNLFAMQVLAGLYLDKTKPYADLKRGEALRLQAAELGNPDAMEKLGDSLMYGGTDQQKSEAIGWYRKAAAAGSIGAKADLGRAFRYAQGVDRDDAEAARWWLQAHDAGNAYSTLQLGYLTRDGNGVAKDTDKALQLFEQAGNAGRTGGWHAAAYLHRSADREERAIDTWRKAADKGHADALDELGFAYFQGRGVPKDYRESLRLTAIAARNGSRRAMTRVADMLNRGIAVEKDPVRAAELYSQTAEKGEVWSMNRLGWAYMNGNGVEKNEARAIELFRQAAEKGDRSAQHSLGYAYVNGRGVEKNIPEGIQWYKKAALRASFSNIALLYRDGSDVEQSNEKAQLYNRRSAHKGDQTAMLALSELLVEEATPQSLSEAFEWIVKAAVAGNEQAQSRLAEVFTDSGEALHAQTEDLSDSNRQDLVKIGRRFEEVKVSCVVLLVDCGELSKQKLQLTAAAKWYRRAGDWPDAKFRLGRMLAANPQEAQGKREAIEALDAAADAGLADAALWKMLNVGNGSSPESVHEFLDRQNPSAAARLAKLSVAGRFGDAAIGPAWNWLEMRTASGDSEAASALVAASLFLGAFDLASNQLDAVPETTMINLGDVDYTLRQTLTFLMSAVREGIVPKSEQLDDMNRLLDRMAARGEETAAELQLMLKEVRHRIATLDSYEPYQPETEVPLEDRLQAIDDRIASKNEGTGLSPLLVPLYQERARLLAGLDRLNDARDAIYRSLAIAKTVNDQSRHLRGTLVYHMEMACIQRKGSDLLFRIGVNEAGLAVAKSAVNHLQEARRSLLGLPQNLQNCFRDLVADQYRNIADLLIRNGYLDEAREVITQLKDFETFRYSNGAQNRVGDSFDAIELSPQQSAIIASIHGLPVAQLVELEQQLAALPEQDDAAAAVIKDQLKTANIALADSLDDLVEAVDAMDSDADRDLAREVSARTLRRLAGRLDRLDTVAMVYSVTLPTRTHFLVVSGDGTEHHEVAITRDALNARIDELRRALADPSSAPVALARRFYEDIWKAAAQALSSIPQDGQVLLVLDGRMRYVPIAALRDDDGWLLEKHRYVTFTPASRDLLLDEEPLDDLRVEALGASRGGSGFTPLPYVRQELETIVGFSQKENAIVEGRAWLDDSFNASSLEDAFASGAPIIHVATHFDLTENEESSRLLLGNGETLSVSALKEGARGGTFDLADVHMMVLSACRTGVSGGSELESFATEMQYEGVRSVLATLWPVADRSTAEFMSRFYANLKAGQSRAEALRDAQLYFTQDDVGTAQKTASRGALPLSEPEADALPGLTHPFYWAGFQMIGQWR